MKRIPYPLRAMRISVAFHPFSVIGGTWFWYVNRSKELSEQAKADGADIWWIRFGPFTFSYGRML